MGKSVAGIGFWFIPTDPLRGAPLPDITGPIEQIKGTDPGEIKYPFNIKRDVSVLGYSKPDISVMEFWELNYPRFVHRKAKLKYFPNYSPLN